MGFLFDFACIAHSLLSPEQRFKRKVANEAYRMQGTFSSPRCFKCNGTGEKTFPNGKTVTCNKCGGSGAHKK